MSESSSDWSAIVSGTDTADSSAPAARATAAAYQNLPPFPQGFAYMVGRLPIKGDTGEAVVELPEPIKGVSCATVMVNSGVLSDCYRPAKNKCSTPVALRGQPINDRQILVTLDGDGEKVTGPGWVAGSQYPGAAPETRSVDVGVPYVEVVLFIGPKCGCSSENWASDDEWGQ